MATNGAPDTGTDQAVVARDVPGNAANCGTGQATLGAGGTAK